MTLERDAGCQYAVVGPMEKVSRESPYPGPLGGVLRLDMARNEYEGAQVVVDARDADVLGLQARASDLRGPAGVIPASCVTVRQVGYVRTVRTRRYPQTRVGLWPDPLLELPRVDVLQGKVQPLWVTVHTQADTAPGEYRGMIALRAQGAPVTRVGITVKVWDVTVPERPTFRAMALDGLQTEAFYDLLLEHRMSPAYALRGWTSVEPQPPVVRREDGRWDFSAVDRVADYCVPRGMNAFIIAQFPKPGRSGFVAYPDDFAERFSEYLKAYAEHLKQKGWLAMGMLFNVDEASPDQWETCKRNYRLSKSIAPEVSVIQCLNEPAGVAALDGFADIWDVYFTQYQQAGVPARQQEGDDAIFAICCYPSTHPNLFTDYPALDARMVGWLSWKAGVSGFEYWSASHWRDNPGRLPHGYLDTIESEWQANTFQRYNGDGYLAYPGPEGRPLSSIRLENLRDGFEDWELLALLRRKGGERADELLRLKDLCNEDMSFSPDPAALMAARRQVLRALTAAD